MIRKVSIIGAATLDGLCSVAAGEMGFIPVCIWQVWMRMGWWVSLFCSSGKSVGVLRPSGLLVQCSRFYKRIGEAGTPEGGTGNCLAEARSGESKMIRFLYSVF